jgi:hypothetical protein
MGEPCRPAPVNLICSVLASRAEWLPAARARLEGAFGPVDLESGVWPFDHTDYYEREMGPSLVRQAFAFRNLAQPDELREAKLTTNRLERELSGEPGGAPARPVNLDAGYVCMDKLVLATTKNHAHRIYLGSGIYAECTLRWRDGAFVPWEWTYPDYASEPYRAFFAQVRGRYREKLKAAGA